MANQEHVDLLKQSVEQWNKWREQQLEIQPDLSKADLHGTDLREYNLSGANLVGTNLNGANLRHANLNHADLNFARLNHADLTFARLGYACLNHADLSYADLSYVRILETVFANLDLRYTKGLLDLVHNGPSPISLHTVQLPQDGSALHFLRGAGVPDEWIDDYCTRMMHPIQYHSLFISYSTKDDTLARRLHADLQAQGVRCWFAPEDLKIGNKFRQHIDQAIHRQDKTLLLLSKDSIASPWVEDEIEAAIEKENRQKREVLFPIRLDNTVMRTSRAWAATLRRTRHIGDFTNWTDPQAYQIAFDRLLRDLKQS